MGSFIPKKVLEVVDRTDWSGSKWIAILRNNFSVDDYWLEAIKAAGIEQKSFLDSLVLLKGLSTGQLIHLAISEQSIDSPAIAALSLREDTATVHQAIELCTNKNYRMRMLGARVLSAARGRPHERKSIQTLLRMLKTERSIRAQEACIWALYQLMADERSTAVLTFANSPSEAVRFAVAVALGGSAAPIALEALMTLTQDEDAEIREWAMSAVNYFCARGQLKLIINSGILPRTFSRVHRSLVLCSRAS